MRMNCSSATTFPSCVKKFPIKLYVLGRLLLYRIYTPRLNLLSSPPSRKDSISPSRLSRAPRILQTRYPKNLHRNKNNTTTIHN